MIRNLLSSTITRPADTTAYASGDLVANSTTAGSVTPFTITSVGVKNMGGFVITRVRVLKSNATATNGSFRVHLFTASPTVSNGDNGAIAFNKAANYIGQFDVTVIAANDGCIGAGVPNSGWGTHVHLKLAGGAAQTIYGLLEARAAYTPASAETFNIIVDGYDA